MSNETNRALRQAITTHLFYQYGHINYFDDCEGMELMNYLLLSVGILLMSISAVHCRAIRGHLSTFRLWAIKTDYYGPLAFGAACGLLVLVLVWPWRY